jgi:heptose I phosphotransferase
MQILKEPFKSRWHQKDAFDYVEQLEGETYRQIGFRRTIHFDFAGQSFFLKYHKGTSVKEIVKNLLTLRMPVLGAENEWIAINQLKRKGIATMEGAAYGCRTWNPLKRESFIITHDLNPAISLEDYCADWRTHRPSPRIKYMLIRKLAATVKGMHDAGINHRDCYLCHFLLQLPFSGDENQLVLSIIDLHRAQFRRQVPRRWRDKDLTGLYYSTLEAGLNTRDYLYFLKLYTGQDYRTLLTSEASLIATAIRKAKRIEQRTKRKSL